MPQFRFSKNISPHDESIPPSVPPQDGLDAIDCSANENNSEKFISANSTNSVYDTTGDPIVFSQKYLNDLSKDLRLSKEKVDLALRLKERNMIVKDVKR